MWQCTMCGVWAVPHAELVRARQAHLAARMLGVQPVADADVHEHERQVAVEDLREDDAHARGGEQLHVEEDDLELVVGVVPARDRQ